MAQIDTTVVDLPPLQPIRDPDVEMDDSDKHELCAGNGTSQRCV
jgi:hypothetical protein